jgi:hypothetical protein
MRLFAWGDGGLLLSALLLGILFPGSGFSDRVMVSPAGRGVVQLSDISIAQDLRRSYAAAHAHAQKMHTMCEHCYQKVARQRQRIDLVPL